MTREEFIEVLDSKGYRYVIEGDKIVVTRGNIMDGDVFLVILETLPLGVEFKNRGDVNLSSLETLPPGVVFNNWGNVYLKSLETLPPGVEFNNGGDVSLKSITGKYFSKWDGNIEGIDSKRLLNLMIKRGMFI